jgi:CRISPR-associated endonuclease/helicase Cas3
VLGEVRRRLEKNEPCFLVSTQCIEAGVDVDFPTLWRALGPYDAIVQAAGRCNRNGRLKPEEAQVHVFRTEDEALPPGVYQTATNQTELLRKMAAADPHDPRSFETYFRLLYQLSVPDECEIQQHREQLRFKEVSKLFNFIESDFSTPLLILTQTVDGQPADTPARAIYERAKLQNIPGTKAKGYFTREDWRCIQPCILSVDFRQKAVQAALAKHSRPVFDASDLELRIWDAGNAGYSGGLNGTGWNWEIDAELSNLLSGGL